MVSTGYKGPKSARGLHPSGYREVLIHNVQEVTQVDSKTQAARIAHTVGKKKRAEIIAEARKMKVVVLNAKEVKEAEEVGEEITEETEEKSTEKQKPKAKPKRKPAVEKKPAKKQELAEAKEEPKAKRKSAKAEKGAEKQ